jgi:hypothetical protein
MQPHWRHNTRDETQQPLVLGKILGSGAKPQLAPAVAVAPGVEQSGDFHDHSGTEFR